MNYKLKTNEIEKLLHASRIETAEGTGHSLRKSLSELLADLLSTPQARNVHAEQSLLDGTAWAPKRGMMKPTFGRRTNRQEALVLSKCYRALMMFERIRLLYSSLLTPLPSLDVRGKDVTVALKCILQWTKLYIDCKAERVAKYQSVSVFNMLTNTESLEHMDLPFGWKVGQLSPWYAHHRAALRRISKCSKVDFYRYAQAFLYFKKGCPPAAEDFIAENLQKHEKALTRVPDKPRVCSVVADGSDDLGQPRKRYTVYSVPGIKNRIREVVHDVFRNYQTPTEWWDPSSNASITSGREQGGQMFEVNLLMSDEWDFFDTGYSVVKVPLWVKPQLSLSRRIFARPVALTEPLKVRVITCENSWSTYALAGAQQSLWKCLKNHPWFVLTGETVTPAHIPYFNSESAKSWISVDYSAATDNLNCHMTRWVAQEIALYCNLPSEFVYESLSSHKLAYGKWSKKEKLAFFGDGDSQRYQKENRKTSDSPYLVEQNNGQLMGSILSFIVLCVANAAVISLALEPEDYKAAKHSGMLVNGDDGLFLGDDNTYECWKALSSHVGLEPSIGKVYKSKDFCVINSQLFYRTDDLVRDCPYPNATAMMQFDAKSYKEPRSILDLGDSARMWLFGFPERHRRDAYELWFETFGPMLKDPKNQPKGRELDTNAMSISWHVPQQFGGLGLPLIGDDPRRDEPLPRLQVARARYCLQVGPAWKKVPVERTVKVFNPFVEEPTWKIVYTHGTPSDRALEVARLLGSVQTEIQSISPLSGFEWEPKGVSTNAFALAALNGRSNLTEVARGLTATKLVSWNQYRDLLKSKACERLWWDIPNITIRDLEDLVVKQGSRVLKAWRPRLPKNTQHLGLSDYGSWLMSLQAERLLVENERTVTEEVAPLPIGTQ